MTPKNEQFCREYMIDMNATQAAIRCGYSKKTANVQGSRLLTKADIKLRIEELQKELRERTGLSAEKVLREMEMIGFSNIQNVLGEGNTIKDITTVGKEIAATVKSVKTTITKTDFETRTQVVIELYDKRATLVDLGRHLGIFETDNAQKKTVFNVTEDE